MEYERNLGPEKKSWARLIYWITGKIGETRPTVSLDVIEHLPFDLPASSFPAYGAARHISKQCEKFCVAKIVTNFVGFALSLLVWLHADIIGDASEPSQLRRWHQRRLLQDENPLRLRRSSSINMEVFW